MADPRMNGVSLDVAVASGVTVTLESAYTPDRIGARTALTPSPAGGQMLVQETGLGTGAEGKAQGKPVRLVRDPGTGNTSGLCPVAGIIAARCSMCQAAVITRYPHGHLLNHAARVQKRRPLIRLAHAVPLPRAHLCTMLAVAKMGWIMPPPDPAFCLAAAVKGSHAAKIDARAVDLLRFAMPRALAGAG